MPGFFRTIRIIFRRHLFRVMRSRRMLIVLLLSCIPAVPVFVMMQRHPGASVDRVIIHASWLLLLQVIVPLVSLIAGSAVVSEEISDRTIGYVFTRPISRPGFLIGRWLATLLSLVAAVTLGVGLLLVAAGPARVIDLGLRFSGAILAGALLGATVYATVFAALGAWFRHPMMVGLGYAFAMELLLANLPGTTMELAIQYHLRAFLLGYGGPVWGGLAGSDLITEPGPEALWTLIVVLALSLTLGCLVIRRKQIA